MKFPAVILCSGNAIRFHGTRKQLLPLPDGSTLLSRIIRQVKARNGYPIVAAVDEKIQQYARWAGADVLVPACYRFTSETLRHTEAVWSPTRTVVLLGDVCYSLEAMNDICNRDTDFAVWANPAECFALSFTRRYWTGILIGLETAVRRAEAITPGFHLATIRQFCLTVHPPPKWIDPLDYTRDFDLEHHVRDFRREVINAGRLDDLMERTDADKR